MSSHQWAAGTSTWKTASSSTRRRAERDALRGDRGVVAGRARRRSRTRPTRSCPTTSRPSAVDARAVRVRGERVRHPDPAVVVERDDVLLGERRRVAGARRGAPVAANDSKIARRSCRSCSVHGLILDTASDRLPSGKGSPMGDEVADTTFSRENRQRYRDKVKLCLDVFARMLAESRFDPDRRSIGLEIELNLTEETGDPALANTHVLELIADDDFQTELAQFNIEINIPPRKLEGAVFSELEETVRRDLNHAEEQAAQAHAHMMIIGILPTLTEELLNGDGAVGQPALQAAQRADLRRPRGGPGDQHRRRRAARDPGRHDRARGRLHERAAAPDDRSGARSARTGTRRRRSPGIQMAIGANSPFFFGRELWRETRIALFEQTTDTRPEELKAQGVRPRVWFGERWITSIFDLFEENVRYFPALLPVVEDEDPMAVLESGGAPRLQELRLHNGTIYRWNRPIYDIARGRPHLRVENRVLPAGPTIVDTLANAAFYYGLVRVLVEDDRPVWSAMSFDAARENFYAGARDGHRRARVLARRGRGAGGRARPAPPAADGPRRPGALGASTPPTPTACWRSSSAAASPASTAPPGRPRPSTASTTSSTAPTPSAR